MGKEGRSFFERLTGTVNVDEFEEEAEELRISDEEKLAKQKQGGLRIEREDLEERMIENEPYQETHLEMESEEEDSEDWMEEENEEGQLTVDVYNTPNEIVIKAIVAGVKPDDLDISITRDMVTIRGKREDAKEVSGDDYFYRELYWGAFSRTILLPQEIEVEDAQASEKHGILNIRLPKIDKEKQTKLKVKAG
jgi:HSP20 family protein